MSDEFIARLGIETPAPDPEPLAGASALEHATTHALDLAEAGVGTVVWCTGFTTDVSWLHLPILDDAGRPTHDRCATAVPGMWLIGFPWLTRRCSGSLYGL